MLLPVGVACECVSGQVAGLERPDAGGIRALSISGEGGGPIRSDPQLTTPHVYSSAPFSQHREVPAFFMVLVKMRLLSIIVFFLSFPLL